MRENETKTTSRDGREYFVRRMRIHPSPYSYTFEVWERTNFGKSEHSTITSFGGFGVDGEGWLGRLGTRRIECVFPAMSQERSDFVRGEFSKQYDLAYELIAEAFGQTSGRRSMGEISVDSEAGLAA